MRCTIKLHLWISHETFVRTFWKQAALISGFIEGHKQNFWDWNPFCVGRCTNDGHDDDDEDDDDDDDNDAFEGHEWNLRFTFQRKERKEPRLLVREEIRSQVRIYLMSQNLFKLQKLI